MKILHVSKKYPHVLGGDAVVVSNLQKQQRAAGHDVVIVTSNCKEVMDDKHIYKFGFADTPAKLDAITCKRLVALLMLFFKMFSILYKEQPDVIHTHSIDMAFFVSFAARFYDIPVIHTFHIVTFYDENQSALRRKTELWLARKAKLQSITAPNAYDVEKLQAAGLKHAVLLANGVDLAFWGTTATTVKKNKAFTFVAVGRIEHQKGYEYLIKAVALLADVISEPFHVTIVGEGSQKASLQKLIRELHVEDRVSLVGSKSPQQIRTLFSRTNAVVAPSLYETTPLTLLEAWAAAKPVVMTSVGILRDAKTTFEAAYVVPPKDEYALMQAMARCLTDEQSRRRAIVKGRKEVKKYGWPLIARTAESLYRGAR